MLVSHPLCDLCVQHTTIASYVMWDGPMKVTMADPATSARLAKILASESRLVLLALISNGPKTVADLHSAVRSRIKTRDSVWRHLEVMRRAGLVVRFYDEDRRKWYYQLKEDELTFVFAGSELRRR